MSLSLKIREKNLTGSLVNEKKENNIVKLQIVNEKI